MSKWKDVHKGDVVTMSGRECRVVKIKAKGKKAAVVLDVRGRRSEGVVKLADKVKIVTTKKELDNVTDAEGTQKRWATKKELAEAMGPIPVGDPKQTKPPAKPSGDPWTEPTAKVEQMLAGILGARLVGESKDEKKGYYVPPVDVSTVASHLALMHGGIPESCSDEGEMLKAHEAQHAEAAKRGMPLAVNHWHTETRP